jgi:hypothetical protein
LLPAEPGGGIGRQQWHLPGLQVLPAAVAIQPGAAAEYFLTQRKTRTGQEQRQRQQE